jgi:hypothetical protein
MKLAGIECGGGCGGIGGCDEIYSATPDEIDVAGWWNESLKADIWLPKLTAAAAAAAAAAAEAGSSFSLIIASSCFFNDLRSFARRFWNQILTCKQQKKQYWKIIRTDNKK